MNLTLLAVLYNQSHITVPHKPISGFDSRLEDTIFLPEKFAELIIKECIYTLQCGIPRDGHTSENFRSREHIRDIADKFGIELPINHYPTRDTSWEDDDRSISPAGIHGD